MSHYVLLTKLLADCKLCPVNAPKPNLSLSLVLTFTELSHRFENNFYKWAEAHNDQETRG